MAHRSKSNKPAAPCRSVLAGLAGLPAQPEAVDGGGVRAGWLHCGVPPREASLVVVDWRGADMALLHKASPPMPDGGATAEDALEATLRRRFASIWRSGALETLRLSEGRRGA